MALALALAGLALSCFLVFSGIETRKKVRQAKQIIVSPAGCRRSQLSLHLPVPAERKSSVETRDQVMFARRNDDPFWARGFHSRSRLPPARSTCSHRPTVATAPSAARSPTPTTTHLKIIRTQNPIQIHPPEA